MALGRAGRSLDPRRLLLLLLPLTLAFRFWLAAVFPMTGDEAYFLEWGRNPDWGFYDHPPMIGWWLAVLAAAGEAAAWLRLPVVVQPALLALGVAWALPRIWPRTSLDRARWAALLVLLAPASVWNVFVTTDTPLVYFSALAGLAWLRATREDAGTGPWYVLAGLFLAGAVLSKYFAAFLGFSFLVHAVLLRRPAVWRGLLIAYAMVLPALALMAWWNAGHCWTNYLFNFVNRHEGAGLSWRTPLLYAATAAYLLTPPGLWLLLRRGDTEEGRGLAVLSFVPLALFALLSLVKQIGLHWLLSFLPFALAWLALRLPQRGLERLGAFFAGFAALHLVLGVAISFLPLETWQRTRLYDGIVLTFETEKLLERTRPYQAEFALASDGYSNAATLAYVAGRHVAVFGPGSSHARHDDILTDWHLLDGGNILVLRKSAPDLADYRPYFRQVEVQEFTERDARFWMVLGRGFDYGAYREGVLAEVRRRWYAVPAWLPLRACYFCERHFPETPCRPPATS